MLYLCSLQFKKYSHVEDDKKIDLVVAYLEGGYELEITSVDRFTKELF